MNKYVTAQIGKGKVVHAIEVVARTGRPYVITECGREKAVADVHSPFPLIEADDNGRKVCDACRVQVLHVTSVHDSDFSSPLRITHRRGYHGANIAGARESVRYGYECSACGAKSGVHDSEREANAKAKAHRVQHYAEHIATQRQARAKAAHDEVITGRTVDLSVTVALQQLRSDRDTLLDLANHVIIERDRMTNAFRSATSDAPVRTTIDNLSTLAAALYAQAETLFVASA